MRTLSFRSVIPFLFVIAILSVASLAHADSVVWNTSFDDQLIAHASGFRFPDGSLPVLASHTGHYGIQGTQVQIQYQVRVSEQSTGMVLSSGAQVPAGTTLSLEFIPHVYTDIDWFTAGRWYGSPYGDWVPQANPPPIACLAKDYVGTTGLDNEPMYVALSVNPPQESLSAISDMNCTLNSDGNATCTPHAGAYTPVFNFASTVGSFYARGKLLYTGYQCVGNNTPMLDVNADSTETPYSLQVPLQTIPFTLTVTAPAGGPPATPTLSSGGSCTVGVAHSITMTSTDPDNDQIRYGVDWNADGSIDEYVPPSGYVPSGSSQSASRTYATSGTKTVKVLAQDQGGLSSSWATLTFDCADASAPPPPPPAGQCNDGIDNNGDGLIDMQDPNCIASGGVSEFNGNNNQNNNQGSTFAPDLRLTVPSLVARNHTVQVTWTADNVASCLPVTGDNGDSFPQVKQSNTSFASPVGGATSTPITTRTTYTFSCTDLNSQTKIKTATVNIQPNFRER